MVEVIDNFLPEDVFLPIQDVLIGSYFPWYFNDFVSYDPTDIDYKKTNDFQFVHNFYKLNSECGYQELCSSFCKVIQPIIKKLNGFCLLRAKANLTTISSVSNKISGYHRDYEVDCTTAVFYINTNNGGTIFKDTEEKVESVANRLVKFDNKLEHSGINCTDKKRRIVVNFNYIE